MKFINHNAFSLLFLLFFGCGSLHAQNLAVCSVEFPDTVTIGETAILKGYVVNQDNITYTDDITVLIDIEDTAPNGILNDEEINETITINQTQLAPKDSIYFEKDVLINVQEFGVGGTDLVVVWPQVSGNDGVIDNEADVQLTYVQEEAEADENRNAYDFLPQAIKDYIELNYPDVSIDHISTVQSNFKIKLDNEVELEFSFEGILQSKEEDHHNNYADDDDDEDGKSDDDDDEGHSDDDDEGGKSDDDDDEGHSDDDDEGDKSDDDDEGHSDDDDEGDKADDDDDEGHSDDDDEGNKADDDDESHNGDNDWYKDGFWNREMELSPFKIIVSNQAIQIMSDDDYKITELILCGINGEIYQHIYNKNKQSRQKIITQNLAHQLIILRIFLEDNEGDPIEFNRKIMLRF